MSDQISANVANKMKTLCQMHEGMSSHASTSEAGSSNSQHGSYATAKQAALAWGNNNNSHHNDSNSNNHNNKKNIDNDYIKNSNNDNNK